MKTSQLLLDFGRSLTLRLLPPKRTSRDPAAVAKGSRKTAGGLRRDPVLESLCADLLARLGLKGVGVQVIWNPRLRTTAGIAHCSVPSIHLNPKLPEISPGEVQRTLRHELAHVLASLRAGRRRISAHGPEWKAACSDLGIPGEPRCHNLPFVRRKIERKHFYSCPHCGTVLARVRPLKRPMACLKCCRKHNGGRYSGRFRFVPLPSERAA